MGIRIANGIFVCIPSLVKYYDEFTERYYSIERLATQLEIDVNYCGYVLTLRFSRFSPALSMLLKHVIVEMNSREVNVNAMTVAKQANAKEIKQHVFIDPSILHRATR